MQTRDDCREQTLPLTTLTQRECPKMPTSSELTARSTGANSPAQDRTFIVTVDGLAAPMGRRQGSACATPIGRLLGLRDTLVAGRLEPAIQRAIGEGRTGVVLWRRAVEGAALLVVRPARAPGAAVVRLDPLAPDTMPLEAPILTQLFGLSRSESEIAAALAGDLSLAEIAAARSVELETVRGQVKALLRKMEFNSQKQLIRVLTRVAIALA